jgi:glutamyl-tRNA synthetase
MESQLTLKKHDGVRTRFAPSPTGKLHLGGARTALFNYLWAKKNQGAFVLRIEDTDVERSTKEYEEDILENLRWLGIMWDEGPCTPEVCAGRSNEVGGMGPYIQSERKKIYEDYIGQLIDKGYLYWCFCTKEELEAQKQDQLARGEAPKYLGRCLNLKPEDIEKCKKDGKRGVLRFRSPSKTIQINDLIRGKVEFDTSLLGDFVVAKDTSTPLYNLAVVIDDYKMKITDVIRGEDHLSNTPKQILIQEALDLPRPKYAHIPLILSKDRSKLSKRKGDFSMDFYRNHGYLPQAIINFLALLGWNPGNEEEFFTLEELIQIFSLERIQKSGAIFNEEKLYYFNGYYIRNLPDIEITESCIPFLTESQLIKQVKGGTFKEFEIIQTGETIDINYLKNVISLFQERIKKLSEISNLADFFFKKEIKYDEGLLLWKNATIKDILKNLETCYNILTQIAQDKWNREEIKNVLMESAERLENRGHLLWPLRTALTGKEASPPPFEVAEILGKEKTLERIKKGIDLLKN